MRRAISLASTESWMGGADINQGVRPKRSARPCLGIVISIISAGAGWTSQSGRRNLIGLRSAISRESMREITVRRATLEDAEFIAKGNARMALETEGRTLDPSILRAGVRAVFSDPARGFYLIAELDGQPAGQMMITFEWSDWRNGVFWWIQSVYTIPGLRGRGVFKALYSRVNAMARESGGVCGLRL